MGYTTDFLCTKADGDLCVRECVFRKKLCLPRTAKLPDNSRDYWLRRGINDWAIVTERKNVTAAENKGEEDGEK